jgi:sugar phosphate isomerase/epimerase
METLYLEPPLWYCFSDSIELQLRYIGNMKRRDFVLITADGWRNAVKVGFHTGLGNLDHVIKTCRQLGIQDVIGGLGRLPGLAERGYVTSERIRSAKQTLAQYGIQLAGIAPPAPSPKAVLGDNEMEIENLCTTLRNIGEAEVEIAHCYPLDRFKNYKEDYHHRKPPLEVMPGEEKWDKIISFFRRLADVGEEANVKVSNHIFATDILVEILDTVKSPNLGVTYCTGTYIFGHDPYASIDHIGIDRIFICHARNLVRHAPGRQGHEEVPLDRGDIHMARYIRVLAERGYDGLIIPEHWGEAGNLADSIAYLRELIDRFSAEKEK